ncbi:MAG: PocR ligand-binding domain-containing protein [Lachnospiraceae bacterium]
MMDILNLLSKAIGYPILFYGFETKQWICASKRNRPFCHILERNPLTNKYCCICDDKAHEFCTKTQNPFSYYCHAGLLEIVCPVYYETIYIGFLVIGQFRTREKSYDKDYIQKLASACNINYDLLIQKYRSHSILSMDTIEGLKLLESLCVRHLIDSGVFTLNEHEIIKKIESYIQMNIHHPLTLEEIADHVYLNPSYLSHIYKDITGRNLSAHIQQQRISTACLLIRTTNLSFIQIAKETGFRDANYFTKVFKKETLMTPRQYKRKWESGELIAEKN